MDDFSIKGTTLEELKVELESCEKSISAFEYMEKSGGCIPPDFYTRWEEFKNKKARLVEKILVTSALKDVK